MFRFEKLDVWQKAVELAGEVYGVTRGFPADERFGLTAQMRRAAVSISSNIAEGSSRSSDVDFARFIEIAYGSLMEVVSQAVLAHRQTFMNEASLKTMYEGRRIGANAQRSSRQASTNEIRVRASSGSGLSTQGSRLC